MPIRVGAGLWRGSALDTSALRRVATAHALPGNDLGAPRPDDAEALRADGAIGKNVVWYTSNRAEKGHLMVALSTNYGHTFRYLDPSTIVPDWGLGFCCDQQVAYSAKYNVFVWVLQYDCAAGTSKPRDRGLQRRAPARTGSGSRSPLPRPERVRLGAVETPGRSSISRRRSSGNRRMHGLIEARSQSTTGTSTGASMSCVRSPVSPRFWRIYRCPSRRQQPVHVSYKSTPRSG